MKILNLQVLQVDNGMSYNSKTSLINYVSKYIGYTFYSAIERQGVPKKMTPFEMQISPKIITRNQ